MVNAAYFAEGSTQYVTWKLEIGRETSKIEGRTFSRRQLVAKAENKRWGGAKKKCERGECCSTKRRAFFLVLIVS